MIDLSALQSTLDTAKKKYESIMKDLTTSRDPSLLAQAANDAWLEVKKCEKEYQNGKVQHKLEVLFNI